METPVKHQLLAVVGPTGSGKTALAVELAKKFNGILISADSRQVYKGLDIGTNKEGEPGFWQDQPARIIDGVPQLLIDIVEPGKRFTLNDWLGLAEKAMAEIWQAEQLPIVAGGTGLYVTALLDGWQPGQGRGATVQKAVDFQALVLQPDVERSILYQRSNKRCQRILPALLNETEHLLQSGVKSEWLEKIGLDYRVACLALHRSNDPETLPEYQQQSRAYIRRQLTWWRHHNQPRFVKNPAAAAKLAQNFLEI